MRKVFVLIVSLGAMMLTAGSAMAKGPMGPVAGKLVISGPGLDRPIVIQEDVFWSEEYGMGGSAGVPGGLTFALQDLGLLQGDPEIGWYVLTPDLSTLGPAYSVQEYLATEGQPLEATAPTTATLYPYAPERPLVQVSVQLPRSTGHTGLWWSAPPSIRSWLVARGLPALPPLAPADLPPRLVVPAAPPAFPVILFALLGLAALVAIGAIAGRRQAARAD
jgi:hypothetical protein